MTETFIPKSSNIDQISYDEATRTMAITFKDGRTWEYLNVPRDTYFGIQHAPSAGTYFHRQIKGRYSESEV